MPRWPGGTFRDGLWGREQVARLCLWGPCHHRTERAGRCRDVAGDVGRKDTTNMILAGKHGSAVSGGEGQERKEGACFCMVRSLQQV